MGESSTNNLYPLLPPDPGIPSGSGNPGNIPVNPDDFRLGQISEVKKFFEEEIEFRRKIFSKYKKAFNAITAVSHTLNAASLASGAVSVTSLAGVVTAPIGIALGGVTIASAIISSGLSWEKKRILKKLDKHEKICTLAISKLNTINDLVSKAMSDSQISSDEFTLILKEKEKYIALKNAARKKHREASSDVDIEAMRKTFLEEGKKLALSEMMGKLKVQK